MARVRLLLLLALFSMLPRVASAEFLRIEMTIFGMD
jgi:hypothetical protein